MQLIYLTSISLPAEIKNLADTLIEKYHYKSFSDLVSDSIKELEKQKEREKWKLAVQKASQDKEYMKILHEEAYFNDFDETM